MRTRLEMPYDIAFVTDSVVCAVSEDRVRFFAADGTERGAYVAENGRIADYHFGGDGVVTVLVDPMRPPAAQSSSRCSRTAAFWRSCR